MKDILLRVRNIFSSPEYERDTRSDRADLLMDKTIANKKTSISELKQTAKAINRNTQMYIIIKSMEPLKLGGRR